MTSPVADAAAAVPGRRTPVTLRQQLRIGLLSRHPLVEAGLTALVGGPGLTGAATALPAAAVTRSGPSAPDLVRAARDLDVVVVDATCLACTPSPADVDRLAAAGVSVVLLVPGAGASGARDLPPGLPRVCLCTAPAALVQGLADAAQRRPHTAPLHLVVPVDDALEQLSPQERRALALYAGGLPAKSVARRMQVTEGTVKEYLKRVRAKLDAAGRPARSKLELRDAAAELGLLDR